MFLVPLSGNPLKILRMIVLWVTIEVMTLKAVWRRPRSLSGLLLVVVYHGLVRAFPAHPRVLEHAGLRQLTRFGDADLPAQKWDKPLRALDGRR